jgi:ABC-type sulfate/molybdate transport systems ATPase subunit
MALVVRDLKVARSGFLLDIPYVVADRGGVALVGRNGAGKTTLLLALQDLLKYSGSVERPPRCAGVSAQPAFLRGSALWNVSITARNSEKALEFLELVGLGELASQRAGRLSSGQRQRLALARALAVEPDVLFLDEPFANVDADARVALRRTLSANAKATNCSIVIATQNYSDVIALAQRVLLLEDGRIEADVTTNQIPSCASPYLQALIEEALPGRGPR